MSDTILSGDFTVYYTNDTGGDKQIRWTGSATGTRTVNELYSAVQDLFDNDSGGVGTNMEEGTPLSAQTPTEYTIGRIEINDTEPWFIDIDSVKHLSGGALRTTGWTRVTSSATGIVKITRTGTNIVSGDIGNTITNTTFSDSGKLLFVSGNTLWIRPDSNAAANNWDSSSGTITCNGHSDTQASAAATGNSIWSNIYTLGTIVAQSELYIYQNNSPLTQWWSTNHLDVLVLTTDMSSTPIDTGIITVYARQYSTLYDHFSVSVASGGRTPIPLATSSDNNNSSGYYTLNGSSGVSDFDLGNYIYVGANWGAATKKGVITAVSGTVTDPDIEYYLIGNLTNFAASDALKEYIPSTGTDGDGTCTVDSVASVGPNATTPATITTTFGGTNQDLSNGNGNRPYSVIVDCQSVAIETVYERLKYITRRGHTSNIDASSQTIVGQAYTAIGDYYLPYDTGSVDNPFTEGETITATGSFSCTVTSKHDRGSSEGFLIVRNVRGTVPVDNTTLTGATSGHTALVDTNSGADLVTAINPVKQSPFGTFAGGVFFGARGVWLADVNPSDATSYELIDSEGVRQSPPNTIAITVSGVVQNTQCYVADAVPNTYLNTTATSNVSGDQYQASTTLTYSSDTAVTVRAREMGYLPFETSGTITSSGLSVTAVWLVDPNFKLRVSGVNISFTNPTTITRASGNFTTDGWLAIMSQVTVEGSTSNDGTYTLSAIGSNTVTISGATLSTEGPLTGVTLTFTRRAPTW